jgi:hypothetical protein
MKHTTILLDESLLLEVQRLAEERHTTTSQIIQQAVAEYLADEHQSAVTASLAEDQLPQDEPSEPLTEPVQPIEARPEPVPLERQLSLAEGGEEKTERFPWAKWVPLVAGGLSALAALFLLIRGVGQFTGRTRVLEVVINYLLPGLLLGVVAAASFFIVSQSEQPHHAWREDNET